MPNGDHSPLISSGESLDAPAGQKTTYHAHSLQVQCEHPVSQAAFAEALRVSECRTSEYRKLFEVVPDANDGTDEVGISYDGPTELHGPEELKPIGSGRYSLKCTFPEEQNTSNPFADADFWNELGQSRSYVVKGLREDLEVKIYAPHQYQFALEFPALGEISRGKKVTKEVKRRGPKEGYQRVTHTENSGKWETWNPRTKGQNTAEATVTQSSDGSVEVKGSYESIPQPVGPVTYTVDGTAVQLDVVEVIGAILELGQKIIGIIKAIQDNVPKIGWYFEANLKLMQGSVALAWGMREHSDHRAYLWMGADLDVEILGVSLELGVGIEAAGCGVQVFGKIEGALSVKLSLQRTSPDWDASIGLPLTATITGGLGLRAEAVVGVQLEGTVTTSLVISGELKVGSSDGLSINTGMTWKGIEATITAEVGFMGMFGGQKTIKKTLVEPADLGKWKWPGGKKYRPTRLSDARTKEILAERFSKGWNIEVIVEEGTLNDTEWGPEGIAERILPYLDRKSIARDEKTIEALGFEINNHFEEQFDGEMDLYQLDNFCLGKLMFMLDGYIDPLQECKNSVA